MVRRRLLPLGLPTAQAVLALALATFSFALPQPVAAQGPPTFDVIEQDVEDLKAVFATVRSRDRIEARVRTPGTVTELTADEGRQVQAGDVLAVVVDQKIALRMAALDAQIVAARSRSETAKSELDRATELARRGVVAQARIDQLKSAFDTAANDVKAAEAERRVALRQVEEGQVLAPAKGRILRVPVTVGSVVLPGESIATIAANEFLLRLELPERHARFIKIGAPLKVGARGLIDERTVIGSGRITQVYPELQAGRVLADAEADGLGDFFVGERVVVWLSAGTRRALSVPPDFVKQRFGLDFVRVQRTGVPPIEVIVQLGQRTNLPDGQTVVEVLAGIKAGDRLVQP